jgi:hypothetical protein
MNTDTEFDISEHAEILATKAIEGFCHAIYSNGQYWGEVFDSYELIYNIFDSDDYPSPEISAAVYNAASAYIDNHFGGPWCTEEEYRALTGADEPYDDSVSNPQDDNAPTP